MNVYLLFENKKVVDIKDVFFDGCITATDIEKYGESKIGDPENFYNFSSSKQFCTRKSGVVLWELDEKEIPPNIKKVDGEYVEKNATELFQDGVIDRETYCNKRRDEIILSLEQLDEKSTRPLRAVLSGYGTDEDKEFLNSIEAEAENLRKELKSLTDNSKANMYE